jgi:hypothetical protein
MSLFRPHAQPRTIYLEKYLLPDRLDTIPPNVQGAGTPGNASGLISELGCESAFCNARRFPHESRMRKDMNERSASAWGVRCGRTGLFALENYTFLTLSFLPK